MQATFQPGETIKMQCPNCQTTLRIKYQSGYETKTIKCPRCNNRAPFTDYLLKGEPQRAQLVDVSTGLTFDLPQGRSIIGRKAVTSAATIQLPCNDLYMSREHINIDYREGSGYEVTLFKPTANDVFVNSRKLIFNCPERLAPGSRIKLPGFELEFRLV